jgi:NAD(P)H-hydrate repair Nnr-like enzyme with NAD(P)H-hydrate dehydratase domain
MARLHGASRGEVEADRLAAAREAARRFGAAVAMKGGGTFVVAPDGREWFCGRGNVGLATSGSGDTLAGVVAGLLARGAGVAEAVVWGVFLHAEAGDRLAREVGPVGFLARELLAKIPRAMAEFDAPG